MNKKELVERVLAGEAVERPPVSLWYHFGIQHESGERFAQTSLAFFRYYDLDFLKVMNDYYYPPPQGLEEVRTRAHLERIEPLDVEKTVWKEQFKALEIISRELRDKAFFLDTVFDPWQTLKRNMAGENMDRLMEEEPEALMKALEIITGNLIAYCRRSLEIGSAGIFLSIAGGREILSRQNFLRFVKPFSLRLLSAVEPLGKMNTAHIHGEDLFFEDVLDLPVQVLSWWDRGPKGPSLAQVKERFKGCVMGGIDQTLVSRSSPAFLRRHVMEGLSLGGRERFFLANGCSIDTWVYPGSVKAILEAARTGC
ncbi:MAG: uroporphyrinogen decarboxylase family protein [bacterium]